MDAPPILPPTGPPPGVAPASEPEPVPPPLPVVPAWRRLVMLVLLVGYVLGIGLASSQQADSRSPALPTSTRAMLFLCLVEVVTFAGVFGIAWIFGRTSAEEMFLRRWNGWKTFAWSALWSVVIRLAAIPAMLAFAGALYLWQRWQGGQPMAMDDLRPKIENLISVEALNDPFYLVIALTLLSFVVGGMREELWRAGVLASFRSLLPGRWRGRRGAAAGVILAGAVFGAAHITQEKAGVVVTAAVGLVLGTVMVWRKSYWESALAHGLFDATSIGLLWGLLKFFPDELKQLVPG
jgi:membrane protease YdiL (CAAX protease family)